MSFEASSPTPSRDGSRIGYSAARREIIHARHVSPYREGEVASHFGSGGPGDRDAGNRELRGGSPADPTKARVHDSLVQQDVTFAGKHLPATACLTQGSKGVHNRILVADDDAIVRDSLATVLESEGYVVDEAGNGREAVSRAIAHMPDLVLLDLNMPHWDGWTAFTQLDRVTPLLPVIVITARPNQYQKAVQLGVDAFMEKPLNIPILMRAIKQLTSEDSGRHMRRITDRTFVTKLLSSSES